MRREVREMPGNVSCVAALGDIDGDNFGDLAYGAPAALGGAGKAGVIYGGSYAAEDLAGLRSTLLFFMMLSTAHVVFGSSTRSPRLLLGPETSLSLTLGKGLGGWSAAGISDLNGDGFADIAIGMPRERGQSVHPGSGVVLAFLGNSSFRTAPRPTLTERSAAFRFQCSDAHSGCGATVTSIGDIDGRGLPDILIGAPQSASLAGVAYIVFGEAVMTMPSMWDQDIAACLVGFRVFGSGPGAQDAGVAYATGDSEANMISDTAFNEVRLDMKASGQQAILGRVNMEGHAGS
eukprot:m51a1_g8647 hypothetical protein (291) ;mRNA; f:18532-23306